jgi:deazaflavin-dependent oxidoreductase (nitroreductase family)
VGAFPFPSVTLLHEDAMAISKPPSGTRGTRKPPGFVARIFLPLAMRQHRRSGDRFRDFDVLYLTTRGAKSGQIRTVPVARFDDGRGGWFVVASANGTPSHPGWYHNVAAHPDEVSVEFGGTTRRVTVQQLDGEERDQAWAGIVQKSPSFGAYPTKTDRQIPVLRLTPVS